MKTTTQDHALADARQALAQRIEARRAEARALLAPPDSVTKWETLLALSDDLLSALPGDREGVRESDQAEALKLFKEVVAMTPPDDANHVKALGYIERFEAR